MTAHGTLWTDRLRTTASAARGATPIPGEARWSYVDRWTFAVVGSALQAAVTRHLPEIEQQDRARLGGEWARPAAVLAVAPLIGLAAVRALEVTPMGRRLVGLTEEEAAAWDRMAPDPTYRFHIRYTSTLKPIADGALVRALLDEHAMPPGTLWVHSESAVWGPRQGRLIDHLWHRTETRATLLEEGWHAALLTG